MSLKKYKKFLMVNAVLAIAVQNTGCGKEATQSEIDNNGNNHNGENNQFIFSVNPNNRFRNRLNRNDNLANRIHNIMNEENGNVIDAIIENVENYEGFQITIGQLIYILGFRGEHDGTIIDGTIQFQNFNNRNNRYSFQRQNPVFDEHNGTISNRDGLNIFSYRHDNVLNRCSIVVNQGNIIIIPIRG